MVEKGEPGPERPDWIDFLHYVADLYDARRVVEVVEKPWKWRSLYTEYLEAGGVNR